MLHKQDSSTSVSFDLKKTLPEASSHCALPLIAEETVVLQPFTARLIDASLPTSAGFSDNQPFGHCIPHYKCRGGLTVPNAVTSLVHGSTPLVVANLSRTHCVKVKKGQPVALFSRAARSDYDTFAVQPP